MLRCPECRTRFADWTALQMHIKLTGHKVCTCGGYPYPHRLMSRYCYDNPQAPAAYIARAGATDEEVLDVSIDLALTNPGRPLKVWPYPARITKK